MNMKKWRAHRKVWLLWGNWWAIQLYVGRYFSLGIHLDFRKPYFDLHFGWFTFSVGNDPIHTPQAEWKQQRCRGFITQDEPVF